jgi:hypothetical protein
LYLYGTAYLLLITDFYNLRSFRSCIMKTDLSNT